MHHFGSAASAAPGMHRTDRRNSIILSVRRYLSGKDFYTQMKNTSKRFSESVRKYFRDGIALYAIATAGYPEILNYLKMSREIRGEE